VPERLPDRPRHASGRCGEVAGIDHITGRWGRIGEPYARDDPVPYQQPNSDKSHQP
jgi:hypothetical protein